jgi:hypothetical protein
MEIAEGPCERRQSGASGGVDGRLYDLGGACRGNRGEQTYAHCGFGLKFAAGLKYIL